MVVVPMGWLRGVLMDTYYCHRSDNVVCVCCPLCGSKDISVAVESVISDSYLCANCRAYFSVTAALPPPTYTITTATFPTVCEHDWDYSRNGTGHSAVCRQCGAMRSVDGNTCWTWSDLVKDGPS